MSAEQALLDWMKKQGGPMNMRDMLLARFHQGMQPEWLNNMLRDLVKQGKIIREKDPETGYIVFSIVPAQEGQEGKCMSQRLFVKNIPWSATDQDLAKHFEQCGPVTGATIVMDRETGRSKGFGFVEMESGAEAAVQNLNGSDFGGRQIVVDMARPREERSSQGPRNRGSRENRRSY